MRLCPASERSLLCSVFTPLATVVVLTGLALVGPGCAQGGNGVPDTGTVSPRDAGPGRDGGGGGMDAGPMCPMSCPMGTVCRGTLCVLACGPDAECTGGRTCCDGGCLDTRRDISNCGACERACDPIGADRCDEGECRCGATTQCSGGMACCGAGCVDLSSSNEHCGECGNDCGDSATCMDGTCVEIPCVPACDVGETCEAGTCRCGLGPACETGSACCDGVCADLQISVVHCGACGNACAGGEMCIDGHCERPCVPACRTGETCVDGTCRCGSGASCTGGRQCCTGSCVDVNNSDSHCGACGNSCGGDTCCSGSCADLDSDNDNCGGCGDSCIIACLLGVCVPF